MSSSPATDPKGKQKKSDHRLVEKIHEQFPEEKIRYHCWVKKINERKTVQDRLLVVGDVHIFTLKASLLGTGSIARVGHLFDIEALESQQQNELSIKYPTFRILVTARNIRRLIQEIRDAHAAISFGSPKGHSFKINVPKELTDGYLPSPVTDELAFLGALNAWSQYRDVMVSPALLEYANEAFQEKRRELVLPAMTEEQFDVVCSVLHHDVYWETIVLEDGDQFPLSHFATAMKYNSTVSDLSITNVQKQWDFFQSLGDCLMQNTSCKISSISLLNTPLSHKGAKAIAEAVRTQLQLQMLHLESCELGLDEMACFSECLSNRITNLQSLSLANNMIGGEGGKHVCSLLKKATSLEQLVLCNTGLEFSSLVSEVAVHPKLVKLDFSDNKLTPEDITHIEDLIGSTKSLVSLSFGTCNLSLDDVTSILSSCRANRKLHFSINFRGNNLHNDSGYSSLTSAFKKAVNLRQLNLDSCNLGDAGLQAVFDACNDVKCLRALSVSKNVLEVTDYDDKKRRVHTARSLGAMLEATNQIKSFTMAGGDGKDGKSYKFGPALGKALQSLAKNKALQSLDITGNNMGNEGADALAHALQLNRSMTALKWDGNNIELEGYKKFLAALKRNNRLSRVQFPQEDFNRMKSSTFAFATAPPTGEAQSLEEKSALQDMDTVLGEITTKTATSHAERKITKAIMLEQTIYSRIKEALVAREEDALYMMNVLEECLTIINDTREGAGHNRREKEIQGLCETISAGGYPAELFFGEIEVEKLRTFIIKSRLFREMEEGENVISYSDYSDLSDEDDLEETEEFKED